MPVLVKCPHCEMELSAPDTLLGKQVGCPRCNQQFTIGSGTGGDSPPAGPPAGLGSGPTARFKTPGSAEQPDPRAGRETISMTGGGQPAPPPPPASSPEPPPASSSTRKADPTRETVSMGGAARSASAPAPSTSTKEPPRAQPPAETPATSRQPAARQAKFISGDSSQARVNLGADGQLPELKLEEGKSSGRRREKREGSNTMLLILVFGFSLGMSLMMLWIPGGASVGDAPSKSEALRELEIHYINDQPLPLEPYQNLLREAKQARSRGDYDTERARYRRVLDMLHAEGKNKFKGLTGVPSGNVPPNDEHLERTLSTLLAE